MTKSAINWYGGKYYMAKTIIEIFPEHTTYVEGFGGAGHIILKKERSKIDVYNDINENLFLFFKILRDKVKRDELITQLQLTPHSRQEFYDCMKSNHEDFDEIERVRRFYTQTMQSFSGVGVSWSYSKNKSRRGMSQATSKILGNIDKNMPDMVDRLREIQVENIDIIELIKKYDGDETLFYLDPPYVPEVRESKEVYDNEMSVEKHIEMRDLLLNVKGKVILSGYDNTIYDNLTKDGWSKIDIGEYKNRNKESSGKKTVTKIEYVWINYEL